MHQLVEQSRFVDRIQHYPISQLNIASDRLQVDFLAQERRAIYRTVEALRHRLDSIEHDLTRLQHKATTESI